MNTSIRDEARTRLGPIDETVLLHQSSGLRDALAKVTARPLPDTDGVVGMVTAPVTAATVSRAASERLAEPEAFVHEIDFDAARRFGGRIGDTGFGGAGAHRWVRMPSSVAISPTSCVCAVAIRLQVYVFDQTVTLTVRGIVPRVGLAGFHPGFGAQAENVFVAPGTLDALAAKAPRGVLAPEGRVLVSNTGGVFSGVSHTDDVALELQIRTAVSPASR